MAKKITIKSLKRPIFSNFNARLGPRASIPAQTFHPPRSKITPTPRWRARNEYNICTIQFALKIFSDCEKINFSLAAPSVSIKLPPSVRVNRWNGLTYGIQYQPNNQSKGEPFGRCWNRWWRCTLLRLTQRTVVPRFWGGSFARMITAGYTQNILRIPTFCPTEQRSMIDRPVFSVHRRKSPMIDNLDKNAKKILDRYNISFFHKLCF